MFRIPKLSVFLIISVLSLQAAAKQVQLNVSLGNSVLPAGQTQTTYLKVSLTGFELEQLTDRTPVNLAVVIDRSGSMQGDKIRKAKEAAVMAVGRLNSADIVSFIAYSSGAEVLVPATKLIDKQAVCNRINSLSAVGSTALFAGVSKGAAEIRKFLEEDRVNRIILISDGIANVGPSSPFELGQLGASLVKEGIAVTTIGLGGGYNEDLMSMLAEKSDGNHYFAENAVDLARVFTGELGDVLSVVAQEVVVTIELSPGIRPVRVLGREADITGQKICARLNQLYSRQETYILVEVEVPAGSAKSILPVGRVEMAYANMATQKSDRLSRSVEVRFSDDKTAVEQALNKKVMVSAVEQIATINNTIAVELRDKGKIKEAEKLLGKNEEYLRSNSQKLKSKRLNDYADVQKEDARNLDEKNWKEQRKKMRETQVQSRNRSSSRK